MVLSLHAKQKDVIRIDGVDYPIDFNFNVVLANMELSQRSDLSDRTKVKVYLKNYLDVSNEQLKEWGFIRQREIYLEITMILFQINPNEIAQPNQKNNDKSVYSFTEDADFIFSSFLKDYGINLLKERNKMHWNEFEALFVSLSEQTKMAEVMRIRSWKKSEHDSKEYAEDMAKLQRIYALKQTQEASELIELERQKMATMTQEERVAYAKEQLAKGGYKHGRRKSRH